MLWLGLEGRKKIKALETDLLAVNESLERYTRAFKQLEMEWTDVLDRLNHQMGRITARKRRQEQLGEPDTSEPNAMDGSDPVSQEILSLRRRR